MSASIILKKGSFLYGGNNSKEYKESWTAKSSNRLPNRSLRWVKDEIWPSYKVEVPSKLINYYISKDGGLYGDLSVINGTVGNDENFNFENNPFAIDPAGGNGSFKLICHETTLWHRISLKLRVARRVNTDNGIKLGDTKKVDKGIRVLKDITNISGDNSSLTTLETKTEIGHSDMLNKDVEYQVDYIKMRPNGTITRTDAPQSLGEDDEYDVEIDYSIGPNYHPINSEGKISIVGIYDSLDNLVDIDPITIFSWTQKPSLLYYVDMSFVKKPNSANDQPVISQKGIDYVNLFNKTKFYMYMFIEFGISYDGGNNIYWNEEWDKHIESLNEKDIDTNHSTTKVPGNLSGFTFTIIGNEYDTNKFLMPPSTNLYFNSNEYNRYWKYYIVEFNASKINNEYNNEDYDRIWQRYLIYNGNGEFENTAKEIKDNKAYADWIKDSKSHLRFLISRQSRTQAWECSLCADLSYGDKTNNMNYIGSTDPLKRNNGSK